MQLVSVQSIRLAPALRVQANGSNDQRMGPGRDQLPMQGVAQAATFINGVDRVAGLDLFFNPVDQALAGEFLRGLDGPVITLNGRHAEVQIHIQTELENVHERLERSVALSRARVSLVVVMMGWDL